MTACSFPTCPAIAPHSEHLLMELGSPYAMRRDRRGVSLWLGDGTLVWRSNPDAVRALRRDVRRIERERWAAEDRADWAAKQPDSDLRAKGER